MSDAEQDPVEEGQEQEPEEPKVFLKQEQITEGLSLLAKTASKTLLL